MLRQLVFEDAEGQLRAVDRHVQLLQQIGDPADVVLVTVCYEHAHDLVGVLFEVGEIGYHKVDAGHVLLGEPQPAVHDQDVRAVFDDGDVLADLVLSSEHHYPELVSCFLCHLFSFQ